MTTRRVLIAMISAVPLLAPGQNEPSAVASRIAEVTVYSDRARVTRAAAVSLRAGAATYAVEKLPGWIDEESVRVAIAPADAARIADVQVKRDYLVRAASADLQKAQAAVLEIADQVAALDDEIKVLDEKAKQIEAIRVFSLDKLPKDAAVREVDIGAYGNVVNFVADSLRLTAAARREAGRKRRELEPELAARQKRLDELKQLRQLEQCTVLVTLDAAAARDAALTLTYMLPGATWEPSHEMRAAGAAPKTVSLASFAVVTQTTGEDWDNVAISFSTQSSAETIRIPELDALLVGSGRPMARLVGGRPESFARAQKRYEVQNGVWFFANNPNEDAQVFASNLGRQSDVQSRASVVFQTLQKRGTTSQFPGRGKPTVRTDGRSVRVPLGEVAFDAVQQVIAAPEVSLNAARTVELTNTSGQPLLPGQVSLYQDGAFLGMTRTEFVAGGESFSLFLGVADQIKLSRVLDPKRSSLVRGRRTRMQVCLDVTVENLSDKDAALRLMDRIPVSEDRDVDVRGVSVQPSVKPDAKGLLRWDLALKPKERYPVRIEYTVEYPPEYVERSKGNAPAASASGKSELYRQLEDLESKF